MSVENVLLYLYISCHSVISVEQTFAHVDV